MLKRLFELLLIAGVVASAYYARGALLSRGEERPRPTLASAPAPGATAPAPATLATATALDGFRPPEVETMRLIHARFATGDFLGALKLADDAMGGATLSDAFHGWLLEQLPTLLTSAGWAKLKLGACDEATTYLRRSEAMKRSLETAKGLAVCYYKEKNLAAAREQFTWYLYKEPTDSQMQLLYTDILESDGRYDEAVKILEALVAAAPPEIPLDALKQRLESMRGRAKDGTLQQVETSRNFRLAYRAGDHEDLVAYVLSTLEDALDEYEESYGFKPPLTQIEVVLYPAEDFKSIVVGGPEWAEGLFDGRLRIPVRAEALSGQDMGSLPVVLRHELVHALFSLMSDSRSLPPWLDEGMAQRLSCAGQACQGFQFGPQPGGFLAAQAFQTPYISLSAVNAGRSYRQSLFLVMTLEKRGGDDALRRLVGGVTTNSDLSSDGLLAPLGLTFKDLHQAASDLWMQRRLPGGR